jgi:hypothetical protein
MAVVSEPRGSSFQEAKLQYEDILVALQQQNGMWENDGDDDD